MLEENFTQWLIKGQQIFLLNSHYSVLVSEYTRVDPSQHEDLCFIGKNILHRNLGGKNILDRNFDYL
ncbi:hypothetical protein KSS87_008806 [Heliosperma pusillum]|nr:hypothetical protein KSS87_019618 [Heliosperma pusillum]KAH9602715.1 hypothetical protein KSS87_019618 [Heliosperma pusillum]KAH9617186.1 hypothetical protein KSS87_015605 [Heliosperma pusillum]KAH9617187.1 hypothetical protein KSS87_015605 [Heliosperma pusillum]KAH9618610.1 hypothetical protein KSS87_015524 [Heliosperma pusillum]